MVVIGIRYLVNIANRASLVADPLRFSASQLYSDRRPVSARLPAGDAENRCVPAQDVDVRLSIRALPAGPDAPDPLARFGGKLVGLLEPLGRWAHTA